jgi:hypothetical protein
MVIKFIFAVVTGVIGSLIANWITATWSDLDAQVRWLISGAIGVLTMLLVVTAPRFNRPQGNRPTTKVLSNSSVGGTVKAESIEVAVDENRDVDLASDNKIKGDLIAKDMKIYPSQGEVDE